MMWDINQFREDLSEFNRLLTKYDIPVDTSSLFSMEGAFSSKNIISYNIKDIEFNIDQRISGTIPVGIECYKITLELVFEVNEEIDCKIDDPFNCDGNYSLQIFIKGQMFDSEEEIKDYFNCWHLDRHIEGGNDSKVSHPFYHFQNGGNELETLGIEGNSIFTGAPRIPHPPMDIFLAFHFIIMNFYNKSSFDFVEKLLKDDEYILIIERAQERMWKPYYSTYNGGSHNSYSIEKLTPLYTVY
ncbi:hypothetical protein DMA11_22975 [Marinilabiliaceae bacterium JC017]|nr:hypothetical protein DMA11_22975 [Marinilabiliaceae bacterium JC017]